MESTMEPAIHQGCAETSSEDNNYVFVYLCIFCDEQFYSNNSCVKHLSNNHFVESDKQKQINNSKEYSEDGCQSYDTQSDFITLCSSETIFNKDAEHREDTIGLELNAKVLESENSREFNKTDGNLTSEIENHILLCADSTSIKGTTKAKRKIKVKAKAKVKAKTIFECKHCQKIYQSKNSLENHRKVHENSEKIKCRYVSCSRTFTSSSGYFHHMRTHTVTNSIQCSFCAKKFYQKCNLQVHIRRCHTLDKPYKCQYCEKAFASSTDNQIHQRLHTGEKPFFCDICNKKFVTSSKMRYHRKMHLKVKNYCCKKCDQKYSTRSLLYKHSLEHTREKLLTAMCVENDSNESIY